MEELHEFDPVEDMSTTGVTMLDALREDFRNENKDRLWSHTVQERPNYEVTYSALIEYEDLVQWQKRCMSGKMLNELAFSKMVLAHQNVAIIRDGSKIVHEGEDITFMNTTFQQVIGAVSATDAIARLYISDGHIISSARGLLTAAGYGEEVFGNPTTSS